MATYAIRANSDQAISWLERAARVGFAAKGILYLTIGVLSARAAIGEGRAVTDTHGALDALHGTFGRPLLAVVALGLAGHGIWRIVEAFTDAEHHGRDAKGIAIRIGLFARGVLHLAIAGTAASLVLWQRGGGGHDAEAKHWTARALAAPAGEWIVGAAALAIGGYGIYQLYRAWTTKLDRELVLWRLRAGLRRAVIAISRFGIAARGVVFGVVGLQVFRAAMHHDPDEAGGTGTSMWQLFALGRWAFITIAAGVAAYGVYQLICARYRRVHAR